VDEMKQRLADLRNRCSFDKTRQAVGKIIQREREDDQPWVSYIYGQLHLARAEALAKVDREAQWYEFERAIARFGELGKSQPQSVKASGMQVYMKSGDALLDSVKALDWQNDDGIILHRLMLAGARLEEAADEMKGPQTPPLTFAEAVTAGVEPRW